MCRPVLEECPKYPYFSAMKIKVLVISDYRDTNSVRPEAELFIGLQQAGLEITVMTFDQAAYIQRFEAAGVRVIGFHPERKLDFLAIRIIRQELKTGGHHILHLFNSRAMLNGIQAARGLPVKVVLYRGYHGHIHWYDPAAYLKYLHPRVDKITCIAEAITATLRQQFFFKKEKPVTIRKGHSPQWYEGTEPDRQALAALGIPPEAFLVVCVANNRRMKGIPWLLKSSYLLPPGLPIHFLLIGKNMDAGHNRQLIEQSPYREQIHLAGFRTDALKLVAAAHVFALPSLYGEATTKAVIEAMSLGVSPVVTSIPGNRELVIHQHSGWVVPPASAEALAAALLRLYQDSALCRQLGAAAKAHIAAHFNLADTIANMKRLYEELAG
jgi:glycosyltransferase involved in cell wall biosynthesis